MKDNDSLESQDRVASPRALPLTMVSRERQSPDLKVLYYDRRVEKRKKRKAFGPTGLPLFVSSTVSATTIRRLRRLIGCFLECRSGERRWVPKRDTSRLGALSRGALVQAPEGSQTRFTAFGNPGRPWQCHPAEAFAFGRIVEKRPMAPPASCRGHRDPADTQ